MLINSDRFDARDIRRMREGVLTNRRPELGLAALRAGLLASTVLVATTAPGLAADAIWLANPGSNDFSTATNWSTAVVPNGTAIFGASNTTSLTFSANTTLGGWTFASGASNYTFVNGQTLTFNGAGIQVLGGSAALINNANLQFLNGSTAANSAITNNGVANFFDTSSAGNAVIVNNNIIGFVNQGTAGSASIVNNSSLLFYNSSSGGSSSITNAGTINFNDSSSAGSSVIVNNGSLFFNDTSTAGSARITNTATFNFGGSSTAGNAVMINNNGINFDNTSTAGNATIINTSTITSLFFNNSSTAGNATIVNTAGFVDFLNTSTGGSARIINGPFANLVFGGLTSAGTTVGSIEGGGTLDLGNKSLTVGSNNLSTTFYGVVQGTGGSLTKVGTGTLVLTNANPYTGATTINGGGLEFDGPVATSGVTVNAGGTLSGFGAITQASGTTTIASGGILAPGNAAVPTGSLTIAGNLAFQSGALYLVQLSASGQASMAAVAGTATLGGANVKAALAPGSYMLGQSITILTAAGGVSGTFSSLSLASANFAAALSYPDANHVALTFTGATLGAGTPLSGNQQAAAGAISRAFNNGGTLPAGIGALFGLTGPSLGNALNSISGEAATAAQQTTFDAMGQFTRLLSDPFLARGGFPAMGGGVIAFAEPEAALGYAGQRTAAERAAQDIFTKAPAPFVPHWSMWTASFGGAQSTDGNATLGSNNTTSRIFGMAAGADYLFSPTTLAGFAMAGGGTNFSVNGSGYGRSDLFQAGAYLRHVDGPSFLSAALAYGWQDITTDRIVTVAGLDHLHAQFDANAWSGRIEGGYRFAPPVTGGIGITPYAAASFVTLDLPAYVEQAMVGTNNFALAYNAKDVTDARSELGIRTDKSWMLSNGILTLRGRFAWAYDFDPERSIAATFQALPGASFVVNGAAQAANSALATVSAEMKWINGWAATATFEGEFSNVTRSYAGKGTLRYLW